MEKLSQATGDDRQRCVPSTLRINPLATPPQRMPTRTRVSHLCLSCAIACVSHAQATITIDSTTAHTPTKRRRSTPMPQPRSWPVPLVCLRPHIPALS